MLAVCCEQRFTIRSPSDDEARHPGCYAVAGGTDGYAATSPVVPVTLNELLQPLDDTTAVRVRNFLGNLVQTLYRGNARVCCTCTKHASSPD